MLRCYAGVSNEPAQKTPAQFAMAGHGQGKPFRVHEDHMAARDAVSHITDLSQGANQFISRYHRERRH